MANTIGNALEHVSKATGSVSHMYKSIELGPQPSMCRLHAAQFPDVFRPIIEETGSVRYAQSSQP
jgi:hypothetical protein